MMALRQEEIEEAIGMAFCLREEFTGGAGLVRSLSQQSFCA